MNIRFRAAGGAVLAAGLLVAAGAALAHDEGSIPNTPGGKAAAARHQNFKQLGGAFKAIADELKKDSPDKAVIAASAQKAKALAGGLPTWFPKGSGPESGVKVEAKPEIWADPNGFAAAAARLQAETTKLAQVADAGDMAAIKAQFGATGGACKNCHDKFRVPDKH